MCTNGQTAPHIRSPQLVQVSAILIMMKIPTQMQPLKALSHSRKKTKKNLQNLVNSEPLSMV